MLSVQEARRRATQLYASAKLGDDPARRKKEAKQQAAETVGAKLPFFLARQKDRVKNGGLRPRTLVEIERHLLFHAKRLHPKPLVEVTRRDIAELLSALTENLSDGTINRIHTSVMSFFGWAVSEGLLESNPAVGTSRRSEKKQRTRLITDAECRLPGRARIALRADAPFVAQNTTNDLAASTLSHRQARLVCQLRR